MPDEDGNLRIVHGSDGDIGKILMSRFIRWLPELAAIAFVAFTAQWFISWREAAATNANLTTALADIAKLRQEFKDEHTFTSDHYLSKLEFLAAQELTAYKLEVGLDKIATQVANTNVTTHKVLDTTQHIQGIAEKLPVPKEKR